MRILYLIQADNALIKKYEGYQRLFLKSRTLLNESKLERLKKNMIKIKETLRKEKVKRKIIVSKLKELKSEIKQLLKDKPEDYKKKVIKLKNKVNLITIYWYGKEHYKVKK